VRHVYCQWLYEQEVVPVVIVVDRRNRMESQQQIRPVLVVFISSAIIIEVLVTLLPYSQALIPSIEPFHTPHL
jgi:hypothetical protein